MTNAKKFRKRKYRKWKPATSRERYCTAKETLGWSHEKMGRVIGVTDRTPYRYSSGEVEMPPASAQLLKLLVLLYMTMSGPKFEGIVEELIPEEA